MTELREMPSSLNDACRKLDVAYAEIEQLRAALKPFAKMADEVDEWQKGTEAKVNFSFDANDLRNARAALGHQQSPTEK